MKKWLDQYKSGGSANSLNRTVTCSNCGWSWRLSDGGKDPMTCHKCGGDIKMQNGGELDEYQDRGQVDFRNQLLQQQRPIVDAIRTQQFVPISEQEMFQNRLRFMPQPVQLQIRQGQKETPYSKQYYKERKAEELKRQVQRNSDLAKTFASFTPGNNIEAGVMGAETFANLNPVMSGPILATNRLAPAIMHPTNNAYWGSDRSIGQNALGVLGAIGDVSMLSPLRNTYTINPFANKNIPSRSVVVPGKNGYIVDLYDKQILRNSPNWLTGYSRIRNTKNIDLTPAIDIHRNNLFERIFKNPPLLKDGDPLTMDLKQFHNFRKFKKNANYITGEFDSDLNKMYRAKINSFTGELPKEINNTIRKLYEDFYTTVDKKIDDYKGPLDKLLGSGAEGSVYSLKNNPKYAVKIGWAINPSEDIVNKASKIQGNNIAVPLRIDLKNNKDIVTVMPNLKNTSLSQKVNHEEALKILEKNINDIYDNGLSLDLDNPANFRYNKNTGLIDIFDLQDSPIPRFTKRQALGLLKKRFSKKDEYYKQGGEIFTSNYESLGLPGGPNNLKKFTQTAIISSRGQWDYPGQTTIIPSNEITMQGVPYPVMGVSNTGDVQYMQPGEDYTYDGDYVTEYPMMQQGGMSISDLKKAYVDAYNNYNQRNFPKETLETRQKAYNTIEPSSYLDIENYRRWNVNEKRKTYYDPRSEEAWKFYLGLTTPEEMKYIKKSKYRPTINPTEKYYYSVDPQLEQDIFNYYKDKVKLNKTLQTDESEIETPLSGEDGAGMLGRFGVSRGHDEQGDYLSYYDRYDLKKFAEKRSKGVPYSIYGRIYYPKKEQGQEIADEYKSGGQHGGLDRWFAEKWVDIKTGKPCGRQEGESRKGYPACRPSKRISSDTPKTSSELSSSERERFKREKTSSQRISYQHQRKEDGGELELAQMGTTTKSKIPKDLSSIGNLYNYFPYDLMENEYLKKQNEFNVQYLKNNSLNSLNNNKINLSVGRFQGAEVPVQLIDELVKSAKKQNIDPWLMVSLMGRESTFGSGTSANEARKRNKTALVSGWNVAEDYIPYLPLRFLADKKVPGVSVNKGVHGWTYNIVDDNELNKYLFQHPELIKQYQEKVAKTPQIGNLNSFDLAAKFLKEKGIQAYNPKSPKYPSLFNEDMRLLKSDIQLKNYMKKLGYNYGGEHFQMKSGGNVPTNPSLWSRAKSLARQKYDVYPSAYANGWAAKWYKSHGGGWRKAEYGMEVMGDGGVPNNPGFNALPEYVQQNIINNMAAGGQKMPPQLAYARFAAAGNLNQLGRYGYQDGGERLPNDFNKFQEFNKTLPDNLRNDNFKYGDYSHYDLYGMWDASGKPKSFDDVKDTEQFGLQEDGTYHGFSVGNDGIWLKPKSHPSAFMEYMQSQLSTDPYFKDNHVIQREDGRLQYVPNNYITKKSLKQKNETDIPQNINPRFMYSAPPSVFSKGGVVLNAGGEKHRIYVKSTNRGEGAKGHIMVNHPTMDKGMWDTIDLTEKAGATTIAQGVAATKKWHRENPYKKQKGGEQINKLKNINLNLPVIHQPEMKPFVFNKFLVNDRNQNLFIGGINPRYQNEHFSVGPYVIGVGNKYFQKFPAAYGISGTYHINDQFDINAGVGPHNMNAGINYNFQEGGQIPTVQGNFKKQNKYGYWVTDEAALAKEAQRLNSKKVLTEGGSLIIFDDNWNIVGVDDNPGEPYSNSPSNQDVFYKPMPQQYISEYDVNQYAEGGGIPERYRNMGFTKVGAKRQSTRPGKKWMVLAKKGDQYKVVHGGWKGMQDFKQHHSEQRRENFWSRMGGKNSSKATNPFSPLYWHKRFGTWQQGGQIMKIGGQSTLNPIVKKDNRNWLEYLKD